MEQADILTDATVAELLEKKHATIEALEEVFSTGSAPRLYTGNRNGAAVIPVWRRGRIPPP
jgi:hypothetical protein